MKKTMTRIVACSLAVLIAFGSVCYNPPKARALGVGSAFAAAATFSYLEAVGMSFEGSVYDGMRDSLLDIFVDLSDNFVSGLGILRADFEAIIAEGVDFLENGHVRISSAAANMLGQFSDWLVDKFGLTAGSETLVSGGCIPFTDAQGVARVAYQVFYDEVNRNWVPPNHLLTVPPNGLITVDLYYPNGDRWSTWGKNDTVRLDFYHEGDDISNVNYNWNHDVGGFLVCFLDRTSKLQHGIIVYDSNGEFLYVVTLNYSWNSALDAFGTDVVSDISIGLKADYEAPPKVEEQYSMVIDTGMTFADEQEFIDSVLAGVAAGTLSPTYDIEETENRDVVVPGEVTDTQAGILSWVKTIAQRVSALPQSIAEAVKSVFVPDAALTTQITDTFASKFSFVPTLHRLGTDLLSIGPDSKPPVVYIHLEDSEGTIDYGGTVKALDMSWYERYKEDGDRIIGGFLWLGFLWLLFKRVPAIINGGEMVQEYTADIDRGSKRRKQ